MDFYLLNMANCCIENSILLLLFHIFSPPKRPTIRYLFTYGLMFTCSVLFTYIDSFLFSILPLNYLLIFTCFLLTQRPIPFKDILWGSLISYLMLIYFQVIFVCVYPNNLTGTHAGNFLVNGTTLLCTIVFLVLAHRFKFKEYYDSHQTMVRIFFLALCLPEFITVQFFITLLSSAPRLVMLCLLLLQFLYVTLLAIVFLISSRKQERLQYDTTEKHITHLNHALDDSQRMVHNFNKHLRYLQNMVAVHLQQQQYTELQENIDDYCNQLLQRTRQEEILLHLDDPVLRALLYGRKTEANKKGIVFYLDADSALLPTFPLTPPQVVEVFDNLMDNAFECAEALPEPRWVRVILTCQKIPSGQYENIFCVQNPYEAINFQAISEERNFTSKGSTHKGIGLKIVSKILTNTQGKFIISAENNIFTAKVIYWD